MPNRYTIGRAKKPPTATVFAVASLHHEHATDHPALGAKISTTIDAQKSNKTAAKID